MMYANTKAKSNSTADSNAVIAQRKGVSMPAVPVLQQATLQQNALEDEAVQGKFDVQPTAQLQEAANNTGLPDNLKSGVESLSGMSMDHVKVHYNSDRPAQLNAHAYAQGSEIHVASGQERHLPHEAWHVVQQAQGRVKPTMQMKGNVPVNDDEGLEHEADVLGAKALGVGQLVEKENTGTTRLTPSTSQPGFTAQLYEASGKQKTALTNAMSADWKKAIRDERSVVGDIVDALAAYCDNHAQAIYFLKNVSYDKWSKADLDGVPAATLEDQQMAAKAVVVEAPPVDPLAKAKKAIRDSGRDFSLFLAGDIQTVKDNFDANQGAGWGAAVATVWQAIDERRVAAARAQAIAALIPAVDALRTPAFLGNAICMAVLDSSKASAGASGKYELTTGYSAGELLAAWTAWYGFQQAADAAALDGFSTFRIGNGTAQDKSARADINTRRFTSQINFSITWKGSIQMHHVGLAGTENAGFTG